MCVCVVYVYVYGILYFFFSEGSPFILSFLQPTYSGLGKKVLESEGKPSKQSKVRFLHLISQLRAE